MTRFLKKLDAKGSSGIPDEPSFLAIGRVYKAHGVRGEMRVYMLTDLPERFTWLETVYVGDETLTAYEVETVRFHKGFALVKLVGVDDRDQIDALKRMFLKVPESEAIPLEEGEYFQYQLVGLTVKTDEGETLGIITEVLETGANDVLVVQGEEKQLLLPDIKDVVQSIDLDAQEMIVTLLEGLR